MKYLASDSRRGVGTSHSANDTNPYMMNERIWTAANRVNFVITTVVDKAKRVWFITT